MEQNQQSANQTQSGQGPTPQIDVAQLVENGKLLGKYETPEALKQGYHNAVQEMNKAKNDLGMAIQVIQQLQAGQPHPQQSVQVPSYEAKLDSLGIPLSEMGQFIDQRAEARAKKIVEEHFGPLVRGANARSRVAAQYPEFAQNEPEIMGYVKQDANLDRTFNALLSTGTDESIGAALELGYFHWLKNKPAKLSPETEAARRAAQTPGSGGGGQVNRQQGLTGAPTQQQVDQAYQAFYDGDARQLFDLRMKDVPLTYSEQMEALARGLNR
jgi:hypothetical protein